MVESEWLGCNLNGKAFLVFFFEDDVWKCWVQGCEPSEIPSQFDFMATCPKTTKIQASILGGSIFADLQNKLQNNQTKQNFIT